MKLKSESWISILIKVVLIISFIGGIGLCLYLIAQGKLTERESTMMGLILTVLSILVSWLISHIYATSQYEESMAEVKGEYRDNLRTYALKAAEKVNNLSNELNRLSIYLEEELNFTEYRSSEEELLAKEERIESAIHLVRTLKSINDTGLSDWEGVIGDELNEQREEQEEKKEDIKSLIEHIDHTLRENELGVAHNRHDTAKVQLELEELRHQLQVAMFQLNDAPIPKAIRKKQKETIKSVCPACHKDIDYRQRASSRSYKCIICKNCASKLVSVYDDEKGFALSIRENKEVEIKSPCCDTPVHVILDTFPGTSSQTICPQCGKPFRAIRTLDGIATRIPGTPREIKTMPLTAEIIDQIYSHLPPQPWPTGIHKIIAEKLSLPHTLVTRAINELMRTQRVNVQINGVIYAPVTPAEDKKL